MVDVVQSLPPPTNPRVPQLLYGRFGFAWLTNIYIYGLPPPLVAAWKCFSKFWLETGDWGLEKKRKKNADMFLTTLAGTRRYFVIFNYLAIQQYIQYIQYIHTPSRNECPQWSRFLLWGFCFVLFYEAFFSFVCQNLCDIVLGCRSFCLDVSAVNFVSVLKSYEINACLACLPRRLHRSRSLSTGAGAG